MLLSALSEQRSWKFWFTLSLFSAFISLLAFATIQLTLGLEQSDFSPPNISTEATPSGTPTYGKQSPTSTKTTTPSTSPTPTPLPTDTQSTPPDFLTPPARGTPTGTPTPVSTGSPTPSPSETPSPSPTQSPTEEPSHLVSPKTLMFIRTGLLVVQYLGGFASLISLGLSLRRYRHPEPTDPMQNPNSVEKPSPDETQTSLDDFGKR